MSRQATSFVLGYHGCDQSIADRVISGDIQLLQSNRAFDWLGPGAYFWKSDPARAREWAEWKAERGEYKNPAVIGAAIDLGNCLDLLTRQDIELVKAAYNSFIKTQKAAGLPIPKNKSPKGKREPDRLLRFLDCAVINHLHETIRSNPEGNREIEPFDSVRGVFTEGKRLYQGCGFRERTHVQIAVLNDSCIKGIFRHRG